MSGTTASCIEEAHKKERSHPLSSRHIHPPLRGMSRYSRRNRHAAIRRSAHLPVSLWHKKRSGIPIAPSETESAAGRDEAKRLPPSPMRADCRGCRERFPRKDSGVFDLLSSSLSCDKTGLTQPSKRFCLRDTELCIRRD